MREGQDKTKKRGERTCDERDDDKGERDESKSYYTQHPMQSITGECLVTAYI